MVMRQKGEKKKKRKGNTLFETFLQPAAPIYTYYICFDQCVLQLQPIKIIIERKKEEIKPVFSCF
jgi:hypothetical protein